MTGQTKARTREILRRTARKRKLYFRRTVSCLVVSIFILIVGMAGILANTQTAGMASVPGGCSSVLLREGAGGYIVVAIGSFACGTAAALVGMRLRERNKKPKEYDDDVY